MSVLGFQLRLGPNTVGAFFFQNFSKITPTGIGADLGWHVLKVYMNGGDRVIVWDGESSPERVLQRIYNPQGEGQV